MSIDTKQTLNEAVGKIEGLSEDVKESIVTQLTDLTTALAESIAVEKEVAIQEETDKRLTDLAESLQTELQENFNQSLSEAATEFMADNVEMFDRALKVDLAESLLKGLSDLFKSHGVLLSPDTAALQEAATTKEAEYTAEITRLKELTESLQEQLFVAQKATAIAEATENLTAIQKDRVVKLAESLQTKDIDVFTRCLVSVVEGMDKKPSEPAKDDKGQASGSNDGGKPVNESVNHVALEAARLLRR